MLTPQQIVDIIETMYPRIDELNTWITSDLIKRVMARVGRGELYLTATDDWQLQAYQAAGGHLEAVQAEIQKWTKATNEEIKQIFEDAGIKASTYDSSFYASHGLEEFNLLQSESMIRLLTDSYERTCKTIENFTRTTATASQKKLIDVLDSAHFKVNSGATSYTQAVQDALHDVVDTQTKVRYPSGHVDTIETAVLRAVRTGVAQASGNMAIQGMIERDWDIILVSAHLGARYGDGGENPSNHFWWQGKFYSRTGKTPELPDFVKATGYGTGEGLCGWNCRHSFGPGDLEHNPFKDYDEEENRKAYDLSQKQRSMERRIRHTKTKLVALREAMEATEDPTVKAGLEETYSKVSQQLLRQNVQYNTFCQENGLKRLSDRIQIAKWSREDAKKSIAAVSGSDSVDKNPNKSYNESDDKRQFERYKAALGRNAPQSFEDFRTLKHGKDWEQFKSYARAIKSGELSPIADFKLYQNVNKEMDDKLVGIMTTTGIQITGKSNHSIARVIGSVEQRRNGVQISDISSALTGANSEILPVKIMKNGKSQKFRNDVVEVSINPDTGKIIQVNPVHTKKKV